MESKRGGKAAVTCADQMLLTTPVWGIKEAENKSRKVS